jgi:hypothetical protein
MKRVIGLRDRGLSKALLTFGAGTEDSACATYIPTMRRF